MKNEIKDLDLNAILDKINQQYASKKIMVRLELD